MTVMCSEQYINVTLQTVEPFKGRIYVVGRSDTCNSEGSGQYTTTLKIPMSGSGSNRCGIMIIKSFGETNQYVSSYKNIIIQDSCEAIKSSYIKSKFIVIYYRMLYISTGHWCRLLLWYNKTQSYSDVVTVRWRLDVYWMLAYRKISL